MRYNYFPYKIIHFDDIQILLKRNKPFLDGKMYFRHEVYPKSPNNEMPLLFRWTYRVNDNGKEIYSCIGEGKYLAMFEKGENPSKDLSMLIGTSHINLEIKWEEETRNTKLYGQTLPHITKEEEDKIIADIIELAKSQGLL